MFDFFELLICGFFTWYLLVELKGISAILGYFSLMPLTDPQHSSIHFSKAASEASPATSLFGFKQRTKSWMSGFVRDWSFFFNNTHLSQIKDNLSTFTLGGESHKRFLQDTDNEKSM